MSRPFEDQCEGRGPSSSRATTRARSSSRTEGIINGARDGSPFHQERQRLDVAVWIHANELAAEGLFNPEEAPGFVGRAANGYVLIRPCLVMDVNDNGTVRGFEFRWIE